MGQHREHRLKYAIFCPWCGTKSLVRDYFNPASKSPDSAPPSFICDNCCTGFQLRQSPRVQFVQRMYASERAQRPPENEHKHFVRSEPLTERSVFELQRIVGVLKGKKPRSRESREHITRSLAALEGELKRRGVTRHSLTYQIGEIFPPGCLPEPYAQLTASEKGVIE
jgi:hypothetical protein